MWVTYATAEANKTWGLLCSRSSMDTWQGCPHKAAPAWLSAAQASFCFPGPGTSLPPQCCDSRAGPLSQGCPDCQPCRPGPRPHLGLTPQQSSVSPGWAAPAPPIMGFKLVPLGWVAARACAGPRSRTRSAHGPARWLLPFAQAHQPETALETSGVGCCIWWQVGRELCNYLSGNYVSTQCPFFGICILPYNVLCL